MDINTIGSNINSSRAKYTEVWSWITKVLIKTNENEFDKFNWVGVVRNYGLFNYQNTFLAAHLIHHGLNLLLCEKIIYRFWLNIFFFFCMSEFIISQVQTKLEIIY